MENAIINFIKNNFSNPLTLLAGYFLSLLLFATLDTFFEKLMPNIYVRFSFYALLWFIWLVIWILEKEKWPKNIKGKVGIVFCIGTENDKQKIRIKNDLIKRIKELINSNNLADQINVILISPQKTQNFLKIIGNYFDKRASCISQGINYFDHPSKEIKTWRKTHNKINGHFFIWGNVKERLEQENRYFFELDSLVTHAPLNQYRQSVIQREFLNIWMKKISFKEQFEFKGFQFSADLIYIAVKYITGIAAFFSGDPFLAVKLHHNLENELNRFNPIPQNIKAVKHKLKELLCEEYICIARVNIENNNHPKVKEFLNKAMAIKANYYSVYLLKSIYDFIVGNPMEALRSVKTAKKYSKNDGTWRYNEAFLQMYLENWEEAVKSYKRISETSYTSEDLTINEVTRFNESYYKSNPEFLQSLYILGFLKLKKQDNYPESFQFFNEFIKKVKNKNKYEFLLIRAQSYMMEIKKKMNL